MITLSHQNGFSFKATDDHAHHIVIDADSQVAPCPTALLVMALLSCCSTDVVAGIKAKGGILHKLTVTSQETLRDAEPRIFTAIELDFCVQASHISEADVHPIIQQALREECHVCVMLSASIEMTYTLAFSNQSV